MKIAFASTDKIHINQHFGWSKSFQLFDVDENGSTFIREIDSSEEPEDEIEKLNYKIGTIEEADIMYCSQIGPKASKMVHAAKIYPMRSNEDERIEEVIEKLQALLSGNPPPWLMRIYLTAKQRDAAQKDA
jgi:nitrogen fixation protein NifX